MRNIYKLSCALMFSCLSAYAQQDSAIVAKGERLLNLGYGVTVKAKESSAAISEVTGEEIMKSAATNPLNALYGKGLGLTVLQNGVSVKFEGGKKGSFVYSDALPFTICAEKEGVSRYFSINSDFFGLLIKDILKFFTNKKPPFDIKQTLYVMAVREKTVEGVNNPDKWLEIKF